MIGVNSTQYSPTTRWKAPTSFEPFEDAAALRALRASREARLQRRSPGGREEVSGYARTTHTTANRHKLMDWSWSSRGVGNIAKVVIFV